MLRAAVTKLLQRAAINGVRRGEAQLLPSSSLRFYCANHAPDESPVALQMINYALGLARSQKTGFSTLLPRY